MIEAAGTLARPGPGRIDDIVFGNANGAGEDNRNVGRMAVLLAGLPVTVPATTVNRLCGSGLDARSPPPGWWRSATRRSSSPAAWSR